MVLTLVSCGKCILRYTCTYMLQQKPVVWKGSHSGFASERCEAPWYYQLKALEGSLLCLHKFFSSTDLAVQVPCLPFFPSALVWLVVWWHCHKEQHCLAVTAQSPCGLISILCFPWVIPQVPHSLAVLARCSLSWLMLLPSVLQESLLDCLSSAVSTFSPVFSWWVLTAMKHPHRGYRPVACWQLEDAVS